jgi:hypothetical protein
VQGNLHVQNAAYRLAWGTIINTIIVRIDLMQIFLGFIPLLAFIAIFVYLKNKYPADPSRRVIIHSAIWSTCYLVVVMELLSIFKWITVAGLVIAWLVPCAIFAVWVWRKKKRGESIALPRVEFPNSWWNRFILVIIIAILITTALVAWLTPPQTWDSLTYHLSRVAHWAQDRSIWHYATGIDRQASMPPGAEELVLNSYVLTQSDRLSAFPEWFAMLGSLIGVSLIAYYLGAKSAGQWLAAGFAATIPIGIVEASSTINDYVATFWVVCVIVECLAYYKHSENRSLVYVSLAAGLAVLTKPVAVPFLIPFALWLAYMLVKRHGVATLLKWGGIAVLIVILLNAGYLTRNYITYGALSNPVDFETHYNQLHTIQGLIVTMLKNMGVHMGLPYLSGLNNTWNQLILKTAVKLGLDINDPRLTAVGYFRVLAPTTAEDSTSNPFHAYLIFALFIVMLFLVKKRGWSLIVYGLLVASTFVLFSFIYKWNVFGTRYDLAFFVIFAPVAGIIFEVFDKYKPGYVIIALLFVGALPWLLSINSRPLIVRPDHSNITSSILTAPRSTIYFANELGIQERYTRITDKIKAAGCNDVGIMLHGDDPEYLLWVLMGAPRSSANIQWIVSSPTARYSPPEYQPCAVICNSCEANESIRGNTFIGGYGDLLLYLKP